MALGNVGSMAVALLGDMKDFDRKMDGATKRVNTFSSSVKKMGTAVTKYAKMAALAATAAVTAFGVSSVKTFVEFDTGMREVFTLMPELSADAREQMTEDVRALSEEIAVLPTEIIPALYQAISAGVPRENVFTFMEIAGKAAIGGVTELEIAVDGLTSVTNAYGAEVISVQEVADIMFTTVKEGKTTFDELSARLFQAVPVAAKIGLEFQNVAAAAAQITLAGVPMRIAMTQIRSLLNEVAFEGKELNKVFVEAAGMSFPQYIESGGDIAGIIEILEGAAERAGITVAELTSNLEAQGAMLNLSGIALEGLRGILDEMSTSAGAADKAYEEMAAGVQYELNQLKVWWQGLKLDIGEDLTESLKDLLSWLEENREAIGEKIEDIFDDLIGGLEWLQQNAEIVKASLITIGVGFTALLAAAHPVAAALVAIVGALGYFESQGGIAQVYDETQALAQAFRDLVFGVEESAKPTEELIALWEEARVVAGKQKDAIAEVNRLLAEYRASEKQTADEVEEFLERITVATDGFAESQIAAIEEVMRVLQEWRDARDEVAAGFEQMWESIKSSTASTLKDMVVEFFTYSKKREAAEKAHQQKLQGIITGASDRLEDIDLSDKRRREDAQTAFNRKQAEIEEWYQEQKRLGKGSTYERLIKLDKEYSEKMVDAQESLAQTLEDLDTDYTRAVEDNADDREQARADEVKAYQDAQLSIGEVLVNMAKDLLWFLSEELLLMAASELVKAVAKTLLLDPTAALNYAAAGQYAVGAAGLAIGAMSIPGYEEGGIVPGPIGAPQLAVVHGGEEIVPPEERMGELDYERLGVAVAAGMGDVMEEFMGDGRPINVYLPDGTVLAQGIYPALQVESERRGGTVL